MSVWGKFLAPVVVPTGGWTWAWDGAGGPYSANVAAGTYGTILSLASALKDAITATSVSVSSVGRVRVTKSGMTAVAWSSCSAAFLSCLGYTTSEAVATGSVQSTYQHLYGWYPGVLSHGESRGDGLASDTSWQVADEAGRVVAGSGAMRAIAPSRRAYSRQIRFGAIRRTEYENRLRGVALLEEHGATRSLRWYPDRDDGTVTAQGTQANPAVTRSDADGYYWLVTLLSEPEVQWSGQHPNISSISLELNGEPT